MNTYDADQYVHVIHLLHAHIDLHHMYSYVGFFFFGLFVLHPLYLLHAHIDLPHMYYPQGFFCIICFGVTLSGLECVV